MPNPLSVLIVDDEVELASLFKDYFEANGMDAVSFTNPLLALEYFKDNQNRLSLVITDLRMPGIYGLELANKIRELNNSIKIFLMTAFDTDELENNETYQSAKINRIVQKPIKLSVLKKIIEEIFSN
ncbi:MAG TPA: response regulator [Candidatus Nitrosocosmicus sp.]|nr:response regulator [Candidatus Nitrosocosmicus sp.]